VVFIYRRINFLQLFLAIGGKILKNLQRKKMMKNGKVKKKSRESLYHNMGSKANNDHPCDIDEYMRERDGQ
jgi:hypothetical protein